MKTAVRIQLIVFISDGEVFIIVQIDIARKRTEYIAKRASHDRGTDIDRDQELDQEHELWKELSSHHCHPRQDPDRDRSKEFIQNRDLDQGRGQDPGHRLRRSHSRRSFIRQTEVDSCSSCATHILCNI